MGKTMNRIPNRTLLAAALLAPLPAAAGLVQFDIAWSGSSGWSMQGQFALDEADLAREHVTETELNSLAFSVFQNGSMRGQFTANGAETLAGINFNFDPVAEAFLVGGFTDADNGQRWNTGAGAVGAGFASGSMSQSVWLDGDRQTASALDIEFDNESTLQATRHIAQVPAPAALSLLLAGLVGLAAASRRRSHA